MGYTWTSINPGDKILAAHWNEVKNNLDDLYNDLELSQYGWNYMPVSSGQVILYSGLKELRDATDYADDMNYCRNDDTSYDNTVYGSENTNQFSGNDSYYKNNVDTGDEGAYYTYVKWGYHSSDKNHDDSTIEGAYNSTVYGSHNSAVDTSHIP